MKYLRRSRKIVFLDRDDTLIKDYGYLNDPSKVVLLDGVCAALKVFRNLGFEFIVTTNQSGLTRGLVSPKNLELIHKKLQNILNLNGIHILDFYSAPYHHRHYRRKPGPGLTKNSTSDYEVDLKNCVFVGDKWRDLVVGHELGAKTILVNEAKNQTPLFKTFVPDMCLKNWDKLTFLLVKQFLNGEETNFSVSKIRDNLKIKLKKSDQRKKVLKTNSSKMK